MTQKIKISTSKRIARSVLMYLNSCVDPQAVDINDQVDGWLAEIGLGWKLKEGSYIDGIACQFIGVLTRDIRRMAVRR